MYFEIVIMRWVIFQSCWNVWKNNETLRALCYPQTCLNFKVFYGIILKFKVLSTTLQPPPKVIVVILVHLFVTLSYFYKTILRNYVKILSRSLIAWPVIVRNSFSTTLMHLTFQWTLKIKREIFQCFSVFFLKIIVFL